MNLSPHISLSKAAGMLPQTICYWFEVFIKDSTTSTTYHYTHSLPEHTHTHIHTYTHTNYTHTYTYTYIHKYTPIHTDMHTHIHPYIKSPTYHQTQLTWHTHTYLKFSLQSSKFIISNLSAWCWYIVHWSNRSSHW